MNIIKIINITIIRPTNHPTSVQKLKFNKFSKTTPSTSEYKTQIYSYIFEEKTCKRIPGRRLAQSQCFPSLDYWFISCVGMIWNQSDRFDQEKWLKSSSQASFVGVQKFPVVLLSRRSRARIHCCASRATHCSVPVMWWAIFICKHLNGFFILSCQRLVVKGDLCL